MSDTREAWLLRGVTLLRPYMEEHGATVPDVVRVSCGFPSRAVRKTLGECWCSGDAAGNQQIFITPTLSDPVRVLDVLVHELLHAALPPKVKHGPKFAKMAHALGLEGKPTATTAGAALTELLRGHVETLGAYPHASLVLGARSVQGTRLLKATCGECGYTVRVTRKWLEAAGTPLCPCNQEPMEEGSV